jgi:hypothetical protein
MLVVGFGGLGAVLRRRRARPSPDPIGVDLRQTPASRPGFFHAQQT